MAHSRLNNIFNDMKHRCYNPKDKCYKDYGARGITVCAEWNNRDRVSAQHNATKGFLAFKKWALENGYNDRLTIDRIDVNKGYSPDNCRWASALVQANNTRSNHYLTYKGKTQSLADWCRELNLNYGTVRSRINRNKWSVKKAFEVQSNVLSPDRIKGIVLKQAPNTIASDA